MSEPTSVGVLPEMAAAPIGSKLAIALTKALSKLPNPKRTRTATVVSNRTGKTFTYHYADLAEIVDAVRPVLAENGLVIIQPVRGRILHTLLIHDSGEWIGGQITLPEFTDSQAMGSVITYLRRYTMCALLGIAAEDDDDGSSATEMQQAVEEKKAEARAHIQKTKALSAHKVVDATPADRPDGELNPAPAEDDEFANVDFRLAKALHAAGLTGEQMKNYYVSKGHLPAEVDLPDMPHDYITTLLVPANWTKAVKAMKGGE